MNAPLIKTRSEQKLEWLESLKRPLTDDESDELRRAFHAIYVRNLRLERIRRLEREASAAALAEHKQDNAETLQRVLAEAGE